MRVLRKKIRIFIQKFNKKRKWIVLFSTLIGLIMVSSLPFSILNYRQKQFDHQVSILQKEAVEQMEKKEPSKVRGDYSGSDIVTLRTKHLSIDPKALIDKFGVGMLSIPSIDLELPILEGITQANLSIGVGTVRPNQQIGKGNFVLLGHYMTNEGLLFGGLKNVEIGDEIKLSFYQQDAIYLVQESKVIHQSEGQYILDNPNDSHWLTLITCEGSQVGTDYRLMVRGKLKT